MRIRIKKGLNINLGEAALTGPESKAPTRAAVLGRDYPGARFDVLVQPGSRVQAGAPLLRERRRPEIVLPAPVSGTVAVVERGARRALLSVAVEVEASPGEAVTFPVPEVLNRAKARALMLSSGLWAALRKRPFGTIPDPDGEPRALLVTAMDTEPLSPDPAPIIGAHREQFAAGLDLMAALCDAPVYLCRAAGADIPGGSGRIQNVEFTGPHPAGLAGTHIHHLCPVGLEGGECWHIGYQDVISAGCLLASGRLWLDRTIALAGPAVRRPRLLTVPLGACVPDLLAGELAEGPVRAISGSALSGHAAAGAEAFLGWRHNQLTVLDAAGAEAPPRTDGAHGGPLIPTAALDAVAPSGILPVPLMRALLVGDVARARDLGALELIEEDLALLSYVCVSQADYGALLRGILGQLLKEAA